MPKIVVVDGAGDPQRGRRFGSQRQSRPGRELLAEMVRHQQGGVAQRLRLARLLDPFRARLALPHDAEAKRL